MFLFYTLSPVLFSLNSKSLVLKRVFTIHVTHAEGRKKIDLASVLQEVLKHLFNLCLCVAVVGKTTSSQGGFTPLQNQECLLQNSFFRWSEAYLVEVFLLYTQNS